MSRFVALRLHATPRQGPATAEGSMLGLHRIPCRRRFLRRRHFLNLMPPVPDPAPHILVADTDADVRTYIAGCLRVHTEVHISQAADGREGLFLARALRPDLVIAGFRMPGLDRVPLCRALRADRTTSKIPVLLVRDQPSDEDAGDGGSSSRSTPPTCGWRWSGCSGSPFALGSPIRPSGPDRADPS